jgi:hypothetical protein
MQTMLGQAHLDRRGWCHLQSLRGKVPGSATSPNEQARRPAVATSPNVQARRPVCKGSTAALIHMAALGRAGKDIQ